MKKIYIFLCLFILPFLLRGIDASISYATFKSNNENYIELSLYVSKNTTSFKQIDLDQYRSEVEVLILFKQEEKIIKYDKYQLNSPIVKKEDRFATNFLDIKRYGLENGEYSITISITDLNSENNIKTFSKDIIVEYSKKDIGLSDIQLISSYKKVVVDNAMSKNGYMMETQAYNHYPHYISNLTFYTEVYNTDIVLKDSYAMRFYIESISKTNEIPKTYNIAYKKYPARNINASILSMDISKVPTGDYQLVVELRNRKDELLSRKATQFERVNTYLNLDIKNYKSISIKNTLIEKMSGKEVRFCLNALIPRVNDDDIFIIEELTKTIDSISQKKYLMTYWGIEDPQHPQLALRDYMKLVKMANKSFSSALYRGYESPRGRIFLKYGMPNQIIGAENEPGTPPYQIWEYSNFSELQNNVKFIFYNPTLAVNEFVMLHSTAIGEHQDEFWQMKLHEKTRHNVENRKGNYFDQNKVRNGFGSSSGKTFRDGF